MVKTYKLKLHKPSIDELWFKQQLLSDKDTMSYNHNYGGTVSFPKSKWKDWYNRWMNNDNRYYRYLKDDNDSFIGEIAYYYDETINSYMCNVIIYSKYRGNGYGSEALDMLCDIAKENGIFELMDEIANDNPSIVLFIKKGFIEISHNKETTLFKKIL